MTKITSLIVDKIAQLARIPVDEKEKDRLAKGFNETLEVVDELFKINVSQVEPTHQTTGLKNIFREDKIEKEKMLSQEQVLSQAKNTHNCYFVTKRRLSSFEDSL